jgi:SM-20-related protein
MRVSSMKKKKSTREYSINGRALYVIDNLLPRQASRSLSRFMASLPFQKLEFDRKGTMMRGFVANFNLAACKDDPIVKAVTAQAQAYFPATRLTLYRMYCNNNVYGDMSYPHRDCQPERAHDLTAVFYANERWEQDWGGETLFYDDEGDAVACVSPRPNRLALFHGAILHRNGLPARECYEPRLALALKFRGRPS